VLVGTADIRRYDLEDDAAVDRLSCRIAEGRKVNFLNFDAERAEFCGRRAPSACAQTNSTISMSGRLGWSPQASSNRVVSNTIDLPVNDFALLAAIGPILRQFSVVSGLRTDDDARLASCR
jgi:hypothetical protein